MSISSPLSTVSAAPVAVERSTSEWRRAIRYLRRDTKVIVGGLLLGLLIITALSAPLLVPYDPNAQEFDLIDALNALRRPTVGVEADGDDQAPFNPHYFIGTWQFEGVLPESPLGESGDFLGTETVRHVDGCTYESTIEATLEDEEITISSLMIYDRRTKYLVRIEDDSRGFELVKMGSLRGDPGGFSSHYWEAPSITREGSMVRLKGRTFLSSPDAFQVRMQMSVGDEPFSNFGTLRWERVDPL